LRALEEEDFDKLPGGIFNKGFVRAYAKFLGIDEEQAVTDFQAAFVEKQQNHPTNGSNGLHYGELLPDVQATASEAPQPDQAAGFMRAAVIIVCLLGLGGLAWKFVAPRFAKEAPGPVPAASSPSPAPAPKIVPQPEKQLPASTVSTPTTGSSPELVKDNAPAPVPTDGLIHLRVRAIERSWVQITVDGKVLLSAEIPASSSRSFTAAKEMIVKLGNAPGVELSYNGKALPQFPADQKTRTLTFTPNGLEPQ
jgi:cytoskeleton protein RodZ